MPTRTTSRSKPTTKRDATPRPSRGRSAREERSREVRARLEESIPEPRCELDFENPFQLLVATILSAQTTDKGVNKITPELFRRYPTPRALADARQEDVEVLVRSTGYFRQKAKHIREAARIVAEEHGGEVPRTMEALTKMPGVARKTANVVLGNAYRIASGIPVDTHVKRVSNRLALTRSQDPVAIERDLMALFPEDSWLTISPRMVLHGRYTCLAKAPRCGECALRPICPAKEAFEAE